MYHEYTQEELRQYCRNNIESLEIWARRLIHEKMLEKYGDSYISKQLEDGNYLVKSEIRKHIQRMMTKEPDRFCRAVDTLFIDQIIYFLCHPVWYKDLFKPALDYIYPQGKDEAREYLNRIVPIRNPLSHSNPITMHDVERVICYSHDFIEGLKKYYKDKGEEEVWNVPRIVKITDSLGNVFNDLEEKIVSHVIIMLPQQLYCYDTYSLELEIDSSFPKDEYTIEWSMVGHDTNQFKNQKKYTVDLGLKDVAQSNMIKCTLISRNEWHKYRTYDHQVHIMLTVYPSPK